MRSDEITFSQFRNWGEQDASLPGIPGTQESASIELSQEPEPESTLGNPQGYPEGRCVIRDEDLRLGCTVATVMRFCVNNDIPFEWVDGWPSGIIIESIHMYWVRRYLRRHGQIVGWPDEQIIEGATDGDSDSSEEWN